MKNVLGKSLKPCCNQPKTGFYRDGFCWTGPEDEGQHVVCAEMTQDFLDFSKKRGNDLSTPNPEYAFPGLRPGDRWCLCVLRWKEALNAGVAPRLRLDACDESTLQYVPLNVLQRYATDRNLS